jgi:hypothetical protein
MHYTSTVLEYLVVKKLSIGSNQPYSMQKEARRGLVVVEEEALECTVVWQPLLA